MVNRGGKNIHALFCPVHPRQPKTPNPRKNTDVFRGGIKTKNADNVRVFGEFQTPPSPPPQNADIFCFFSPIFCWFLGDGVQIRDPKHSFLAFPESVQKVVGSISKIGQFFDHLNF